jgi:hypothetical protein
MSHFLHPYSDQYEEDPALAKSCANGKQFVYPDRWAQIKTSIKFD